jgi:hypothetical protein
LSADKSRHLIYGQEKLHGVDRITQSVDYSLIDIILPKKQTIVKGFTEFLHLKDK